MNIKRLVILTGTALLGLSLVTPWLLSHSGTALPVARAAGPWYVAPSGDNINDCLSPITPCATINGAIGKASSGDTIYVAAGTYTGAVVHLNKNATLSGGWDDTFTTQSGTSTIDGEGSRRGITVNRGKTAIIERFAVQNGWSDWVVGDGGGISNSGTLTLNSSTVSGNTVVSAFIDGGGIYNVGTMVLNNSIVSGNKARDGTGGGIYSSFGTMTFNNSTVSDNMSGGIYYNEGAVTLNNSTVSGNMGGGIHNSGGTLTLNNSTISDNTSRFGGGIDQNGGTVILNNSTISGNTANGDGGGISKGGGTMTLQNTILADNISRLGISPDCSGEIGTLGYNLIGDTSGCIFTPGTGDLTDVGANLGELIGIPGAPMYRPLLSGSPAIDAGNPAGCTGSSGPLLTDQRGVTRPQGAACDIGSYEYTTPGPADIIAAVGGTPQRTTPSFAFWMPLQAAVLDSIGSPVKNAMVTFSAPASGASGTFADTGTFTATAVTNESADATAAIFTANGLTGSYTVTARVGSVVTPTNFSLGNIGWYVAPGGNDVNDCQTPTTTCATINGTLSKAGFTADDTVLVAIGTYTGTGDEVVLLDKSVRLLGGWDNTFSTQSSTSTIDGEDARRGITVNSGVTVIVERFTVLNGFIGYPAAGGGVLNDGGTLTLNNSTVSGNKAEWRGGGIENRGTMTLNSSTINGNTSNDSGGGITSYGTLTLNNSTVSGNMANSGGGIDGHFLTLNNSIVSGNTANDDGGGIDGDFLTLNNSTVSGNTANDSGGGINVGFLSLMTLNNSTVSGNTANSRGGGIYNYGSTITLNNTTVSDNVAQWAGGIYNNSGSVTSAIVTLKNSIVAGNTASISGPDCVRIDSTGHNLIGDTSGCGFTSSSGDLEDIDPRLFPLIDTPGYHPLLPGSPAIDAGNPAGCEDHLGNPLDTDQRGVARVDRCDIGSYEFDPDNDPLHYVNLAIITRNYYYCPLLFADDFSDTTSGWPVGDDGNIRYEYLTGEYRILVRNTDWWAGARPGFIASDYNLTVDVRNATGNYGSYGLVFGLSDDWSQFYTFEIDPDGYYGIFRYSNGTWTSLAEGTSGSINTGTTMNRLKIKRDGTLIEAYANGELLASVSDGSYTGMRYMGLIVSSYDESNVDARFDNSAVYPVWCNLAADQSSEARRIPNMEIMESMDPGRKVSQPNSRKR